MSLNKRLMSSAPPAFVASENFGVVAYTGNSSSQAITVGFKPDFVITKPRNNSGYWWAADSTRGGTKVLATNTSNAEITRSFNYKHIRNYT